MFRFSIRELMLVTAVVLLAAGWWMEHRQNTVLKQENEALHMGNDFMSGNWDKIVDELNAKRLQLGEPVALAVEEDPNEKIQIRQLGSSLLKK